MIEAEDFQTLYNLMRGNSDAIVIMDARGLFLNGDPVSALDKIADSFQRYSQAKQNVLRLTVSDDDKGKSKEQIAKDKRLRKKQSKYREVIDKFEEVIEALKPLAERAEAKKAAEQKEAQADSDDNAASAETAYVTSASEQTAGGEDGRMTLDEFLVAYDQAPDAHAKRFFIDQCFAVAEVAEENDFQPGELYFIDGGSLQYLAIAGGVEDGRIKLTSAINGESHKPAAIKTLLKLAARGNVIRLSVKEYSEPDPAANSAEANDTPMSSRETVSDINETSLQQSGPFFTDTSSLPDDDDDDDEDIIQSSGLQESAATAKVLDKGAFSQLVDAASRTRICSGVDQIAHVRDREFRRGQFQEALQIVEGIYNKYVGAVSSRNARLRQEELDINSGRKQMSPKELQAKRVKDNADNQLIERASSRFSRVLDGLRVLLRMQQDNDEG